MGNSSISAEDARENAIQYVAHMMRDMNFNIEFAVKKKPQGMKIIFEVTQDQMDEIMKMKNRQG